MSQVRLSDVVEALVQEGVSGEQLLAVIRRLEQRALPARVAPNNVPPGPAVIVNFRQHPRIRSSVSIPGRVFRRLVRATGSLDSARKVVRDKAREAPVNVLNRSAWVQAELEAWLDSRSAEA